MKSEKYCFLAILVQLCGYTLAAPPQNPSLIHYESTFPGLGHSENGTITDNLIQNAACRATASNPELLPSRNSNFPKEDYAYDVPDSLVTVNFSNYGVAISEACARLVITLANRQLLLHKGEYDKPIGRWVEVKSKQLTEVSLNPWPEMTWRNWGDTLKGLEHFVTYHGAVCFEFDVEVRAQKDAQRYLVGTGTFC